MNKRQLSAVLLIAGLGLSAVPAAESQQVQLKGPKNASREYSGATVGPITKDDTLWAIASKYARQDREIGVYQVMLAIYQLNPAAFENDNLNLMRDGAVLKLPSVAYVKRVDAKAARERVEIDEQRWRKQSNDDKTPEKATASEKVSNEALETAKQELQTKLDTLSSQQTEQFMQLRDQFGASIENIERLLEENRKVYQRLDAVSQELADLQTRVGEGGEVEQQLTDLARSQAMLSDQLRQAREEEERRRMEAEKGLDIPWWVWVASGGTLLLLGVAFFMWRKLAGNSEPAPTPVTATETPVSAPPLAKPDLSTPATAPITHARLDDEDMLDSLGEEIMDDDLFGTAELDTPLDLGNDSLDDLNDELSSMEAELDETVLDTPLDAELSAEDEAPPVAELGEELISQGDLDDLFDNQDDDELLTPPKAEVVSNETASAEIAPEPAAQDDTELQVLKNNDEATEALNAEDFTDIEIMSLEGKAALNAGQMENLGEEIEQNSVKIDELADQLINDLDSFDEMQSMIGDLDDADDTAEPASDSQNEGDPDNDLADELLAELAPEANDAPAQSADEFDALSDDLLDELIAENQPAPAAEQPDSDNDDVLSDELLDELIAENQSLNEQAPLDDQDELSDALLDELVDPQEANEGATPELTADEMLSELPASTGDEELDAALDALDAEPDEPRKQAPVPQDLDQYASELDDLLDDASLESFEFDGELADDESELDVLTSQSEDNDDSQLLDELENTSFDELLNDIPELGAESLESQPNSRQSAPALDNPDLDLEALLQDPEASEEDYLDVESLLAESDEDIGDPPPALAIDLSELGLDLASEDNAESEDEGDSQLDLAIAYMEMGDNELAKELLLEMQQSATGNKLSEVNRLLNNIDTLS